MCGHAQAGDIDKRQGKSMFKIKVRIIIDTTMVNFLFTKFNGIWYIFLK